MGRPPRQRWIAVDPPATLFKPAGIPASALRVTRLSLDELEAIRLVDGQQMDQAEAAQHMKVSRATVGRILSRAHQKIAQALVSGQALSIEQGHAPIQRHIEAVDQQPAAGSERPRRGAGRGRQHRHHGRGRQAFNPPPGGLQI